MYSNKSILTINSYNPYLVYHSDKPTKSNKFVTYFFIKIDIAPGSIIKLIAIHKKGCYIY